MKLINAILFIFILSSCSDSVDSQPNNDWLIPSEEVFDGGPGKDGIPSVDNPNFELVSDVSFLNNNDLVVGIVIDGQAKAYPHAILNWHEIVNDELAGKNYALTYCPLTGSAVAWDNLINGDVTTFGVSGKLYNSNLMPYDRKTDSYWSQLELKSVNGANIGTKINTFPIIETSWKTWKESYPNSLVMNTNTGFSRDYSDYPYGDYITNHNNIIFPLNPLDDRLPAKERALAVLTDTQNKAYSIKLFEDQRIIEDKIAGEDIVIMGSESSNYIVAYKKGQLGQLSSVDDMYPVIAVDENNNQLSISGRIISGPLEGEQLEATNSFIAYWMALGAFYKDIEIYN